MHISDNACAEIACNSRSVKALKIATFKAKAAKFKNVNLAAALMSLYPVAQT